MKETIYHLHAPIQMRIALLADLHNRPCQSIIGALAVHRPDMICIAGDLICGSAPAEGALVIQSERNALPFLTACRKLAPTFVSIGNHEWRLSDADFRLIRSTGVALLDNSWRAWNGLIIGGLSSARATDYRKYRSGRAGRYPKPEYAPMTPAKPETAWLDAFEQQQGYHILLSHHPEYWTPYLMNRRIDLVLSGHAHGGQIRIFDHGLYAPGQGLWPRYTRGCHSGAFGTMVVSTGLSNTGGIIPRLFNPREIVYIRLEPRPQKH